MSTTLTAQITAVLTSKLGRAPSGDEVINAESDAGVLLEVLQTLDVGTNQIVVNDTADLQAILDNLGSDGGGILYLLAGTYVLGADLSIPSKTQIIGVGPTLTTLVGAAGYVVKCHGISGTHKTDIVIRGVGFSGGASGTMLDFQYVDRIILENVVISGNVNGLIFDNCTDLNLSTVESAGNSGYGITISNTSNIDARSVIAVSNGGAGIILDTISTFSFLACDFASNTGAGMTQSSCSAGNMTVTSSGNGSDGMTLTSSSCKFIGCTFDGNGAYGVNISDSGSDNNIILGCEFAGNTTAAATDSGTGTLIRSNIGLSDN